MPTFHHLYRSAGARIMPGLFVLAAVALLLVSCDKTDCPPTCACSPDELPAVEYNGWLPMNSGTRANLNAVWGFDTGEAYAVGDNGTILYYDGTSWERLNSGTQADLLDVFGGPGLPVLVTGENGTILRPGPSGWLRIESGTTESINAIWGVDASDCGYEWDPYSWECHFATVAGAPGTLLRIAGTAVEFVDTGAPAEFLDVTGWASTRYCYLTVVAVGKNGTAYCLHKYHNDETEEWTAMDMGTNEDLVAVFGDAPDNVYAVSASGTVFQNTKRFSTTGPTRAWRKVTELMGSGYAGIAARTYNDLFFVGAQGRVDSYDRSMFTEMSSGVRTDLNAVWAGENDVYAVGNGGVILRNGDPPLTAPCPVNVSVSVSEGTTPTITWSPPCPVAKILLRVMIYADGNLIRSGIRYGEELPNAMRTPFPDIPLEKDNVYVLNLIRREPNNERIIGTWNVVPEDTANGGRTTITQLTSFDDRTEAAYGDGGFYFQRLISVSPDPPPPGEPEQMLFYGISRISDGRWRRYVDPALREDELNIRRVMVIVPYRNPETGEREIYVNDNLRAADIGEYTVLWDVIDPE